MIRKLLDRTWYETERPLYSFWGILLLMLLITVASFGQRKLSSEFELIQKEMNQMKLQNPGKSFDTIEDIPFTLQNYVIEDGYITIDAIVAEKQSPKALLQKLRSMGLKYGSTYGPMVSGMMPLNVLTEEKMIGVRSLRSMRPTKFIANVGRVTSQGDAAQLSDQARQQFGVNGEGVQVGILSDSYDRRRRNADISVSEGDLPGPGNPNGFTNPVEVLQDFRRRTVDEGRAMAEIVHDVAPGATISFHTATRSGQAGFANAIIALADNGADVIVDDILFFAEEMYQDGIIAQAVDEVTQRGVVYFSAAGNAGDEVFTADFVNSPNPTVLRDQQFGNVIGNYILHDFDPGSGVNNFLPVDIVDLNLILQWSEPSAGACVGCPGPEVEIDIFLADEDGNFNSISRGASAPNNDNVGNLPVELVLARRTVGPPRSAYFVIGKRIDATTDLNKPIEFKMINFGREADISANTEIGGTTYGHANAAGAIAVGAVDYRQTPAFGVSAPLRENFSASGGVPILFDTRGNPINRQVRLKPAIMAPNGANTTFFGGTDIEGDGFPNFLGTSAAAPHAAAVAALMIEAADNGLSPAEIEAALTSTAIDMQPNRSALPAPPPGTPSAFDFDTGFGFIQATDAIAAVTNGTPPPPPPPPPPTGPTVTNLLLINHRTEEVLATISNNSVFDLATLPVVRERVSVLAEASDDTSSVQFELSGTLSRSLTDNDAPFNLTPRRSNNRLRALRLRTGDYQLSATAFTENNGTGTAGEELLVSFQVINSTNAPSSIVANNNGVITNGIDIGEEKGTLQVYPNPSNGSPNMVLPEGEAKITVFGPGGQFIMSDQLQENQVEHIDLSNYAPGIYFVKVQPTAGKAYTKKVIIRN